MDKTLDIRQLSTCCGKRLVWKDLGPCVSWFASCLACGGGFWAERSKEPERGLLWTERVLLARIAELEATIANERGEGDPPVPGWRYDENSGRWWIGDVVVGRPLPPAVGWRWGDRQGWDWQKAGTARDAMRAASAVSPGADAPKEG